MRFYAIYKDVPSEIAIFNTEAERDEWVRYEDKFAKTFMSEADRQEERMAITREDAEFLICSYLLDAEEDYIPDLSLPNVSWAILDVGLNGLEIIRRDFMEYLEEKCKQQVAV